MTKRTAFGNEYIDTDDVDISRLAGKDDNGFPMASSLLLKIADQLNEALKEIDPESGISIRFLNILNRDRNPDGTNVFFRVFKNQTQIDGTST